MEVKAKTEQLGQPGNIGTYYSDFTVDLTSPLIEMSVPSVTSSNTFNIMINCSDNYGFNQGPVGDYDIIITSGGLRVGESDCSSSNTITVQVDLGNDAVSGEKTILATITDRAGNINSTQKTVTLDNTIPSINIDEVITTSNTYTNPTSFITSENNLRVLGTYQSAADIKVLVNGSEKSVSNEVINSTHFSFIFDVSYQANEETQNNITILGTGSNGLQGTDSFTIILDKKAPTITSFSPANNATTNARPTITLTTDEQARCSVSYDPIAGPQYRKEENLIYSTDKLTHTIQLSYNLDNDLTYEQGRTTTLAIVCRDDFENSETLNVDLNVDMIYPTIIDIVPDTNLKDLVDSSLASKRYNIYSFQETYLDISVNETARCKYSTQGKTNFDNMENDISAGAYLTTHRTPLLQLSNGDNTYHIACQDRAGNTAPIWSIILEYTDQPTVSIYNVNLADYITDLTPEIIFRTNQDATCNINSQDIYLFSSTNTQISNFVSTNKGEYYEHKATLSTDAGYLANLPDETSYSIDVTCSGTGLGPKTKTISFTIWTSGPGLVNVTPTTEAHTSI